MTSHLTNIILPSLFFSPLLSTCLYQVLWRIPSFCGFRIFRRVISPLFEFPVSSVDKYFASYFYFMFICLSLLSYYAWQTLRGRWTLSYFHVTTCHYLDPSVSCFLLTHVYHLTSSMLSPDHLTCHYLARPFCYTMTYLAIINLLSLSLIHI